MSRFEEDNFGKMSFDLKLPLAARDIYLFILISVSKFPDECLMINIVACFYIINVIHSLQYEYVLCLCFGPPGNAVNRSKPAYVVLECITECP